MVDFEIEQRLIGSQNLQDLCNRLAPGSTFEVLEDVTGYLAAHGTVRAASIIRHHRPGGSTRHVLEVLERGGAEGDRYVMLTINRAFQRDEALTIYRHWKAKYGQ